ncbi:MAG: hypothetical protein IT214_14220 [Chitinophagaceae bacterium]|jgi:hypothetical protein|nr:hypothetical protein [Chitinophagaceae bacterium]OQY96821.1 MAG: hypothetical protein B6D37_00735 [Sphingobacteriales bacterium UTBCD1]
MPRIISVTVLLLYSSVALSQMAYLFVKKGGHKKKVYVEEDRIVLELRNGTIYRGLITHLIDDTIFVNGKPVPVDSVSAVIIREGTKKSFRVSAEALLLITGGVALTTLGLTASKQAKFREALAAGLAIGYGPLLIYYIGSKISFHRKRFIIGKKFHLQLLDLRIPPKRSF